jgi:hypothetical protein
MKEKLLYFFFLKSEEKLFELHDRKVSGSKDFI